MRQGISRADSTTRLVFKSVAVALFFAPWIAVVLSVFAPRPLPSQVNYALHVVFLAFFAPLYLPLSIFWLAVDVLGFGGPESFDGTLSALICIPLSPLLVAVNALLWATLITVAFVLTRRLRERRHVSKDV